MSSTSAINTGSRVASVDILRGIVMIIMALDHVRLYMGPTPFSAEDPSQTSAALFFTRWITHFCAPVFVFLAGTSAFLYRKYSGSSVKQLSRFLLTRGLWIIFTEIFLLNFVVQGYPYQFLFLQVLWAIGFSMMFLGALVYLPQKWILTVGLVMIFGHNLLDSIRPESFGMFSWFWMILHSQGMMMSGNFPVIFYYPLIPWLGVMACGYVFGNILLKPQEKRDKLLIYIGLSSVILFVALRILNLYGDLHPWQVQERGPVYTLLSFLNVTKYPPSLLFLLMFIGTPLLLMPLLDRIPSRLAGFLAVFGRVPFFYYLLHFAVIHVIAIVWSMVNFGYSGWWLGNPDQFPEGYQLNLWWVYGVWLCVIAVLYPVCRWYMKYKKAHREKWWLSYV